MHRRYRIRLVISGCRSLHPASEMTIILQNRTNVRRTMRRHIGYLKADLNRGGVWAMRTLLTFAALFLVASEPTWAQGFFPFGSPSQHSYRLPSYPYFTPPARSHRRASPKPAKVQIPQPEKTTISEEYAKGSIVIVNHERNLYFVEETGQAIRYPVAIGKVEDQWDGTQAITAKRENPTWYPPEEIQWEANVPAVVPAGPQNPLGPGRYTSAIPCIESTVQTGPARSAARCRMDVFACTTRTSSNCTKKYRLARTSTCCRKRLEPAFLTRTKLARTTERNGCD
jgi:hypothetical protein